VDKFLVALYVGVVLLLATTGEYIGGRIILPAMGLTAPGFDTWFWFTFIILLFSLVLYFLKELFD
jgi:hypothetical protein